MNGLLEMFRHKTWATLRLIEHCQGLEDEHLDATTPKPLLRQATVYRMGQSHWMSSRSASGEWARIRRPWHRRLTSLAEMSRPLTAGTCQGQ